MPKLVLISMPRRGGKATLMKKWMEKVPDWTPQEIEATFNLIEQMWGSAAAHEFRNSRIIECIAHSMRNAGGAVSLFVHADYADGTSETQILRAIKEDMGLPRTVASYIPCPRCNNGILKGGCNVCGGSGQLLEGGIHNVTRNVRRV